MNTKRIAPDADRYKAIAEMAAALSEKSDRQKYSLGIEFTLAELVRTEMRQISQVQDQSYVGDILSFAIKRVVHRIDGILNENRSNIDFKKYVTAVREKLKYPAKEMQQLAAELSRSRTTQKLGVVQELEGESGRRSVVHELGLRESIQGLIAEATGDDDNLNIDALREKGRWPVLGEWFPYELIVEEFVFVIDDDGSVFVSTENLPKEMREKAGGMLRRIVDVLYT